jgi:chemotaxis protein methyltransferase CheR
MSKKEFDAFRALLRERCGLKVSDKKQLLLKNRIGKRLKALGYSSFKTYYDYLMNAEETDEELKRLWSVVTTHQTHFFREPHHFDALVKYVLPELVERRQSSRTLSIWSAGCATGQEPYTLAAVLADYFGLDSTWKISISGTDIDAEGIETARLGKYPIELKKEIPARYYFQYFEADGKTLKVSDALRRRVTFRQQNLRNLNGWQKKFDLIFCRNVVMYFEPYFRAELANYFHSRLHDDGYLFLGSSESLYGMPKIFKPRKVGKTIVYCKANSIGGAKK